MEEIPARGADLARQAADQPQQHRDVVGRERPEAVLFTAKAPQVETVGVHISDTPERPISHHLVELVDRRMIVEEVPHHQHQPLGLGQGHQLLALLDIERQGLLDEDVLAAFEEMASEASVLYSRRGDGDGVLRRDLGDVGPNRHLGPLDLKLGGARFIRLDDPSQHPEVVEVASDVLAPATTADERDSVR